jgi:hypothetical protein
LKRSVGAKKAEQSGSKVVTTIPKFFHRFASYRRNKKHLWEIKDDSGCVHSGQENIKETTQCFFKSFFQDTGQTSIIDQIELVRLYPRIVQ